MTNESSQEGLVASSLQKENKKVNKKNKFVKQTRDWIKAGETYTQDPNNLWLCPNLNYKTKAVFHVVMMHNPSFPSAARIARILKMSKKVVLCCLYELLARKILLITKESEGRRANTYLANMNISSWDIDSQPENLTWGGESVVYRLRFPRGTTKKRCGSHGEPQNDLAVPTGNHKSDVAVPTGNHIYINPHTNGEINIGIEEMNRPTPLVGGPSGGGVFSQMLMSTSMVVMKGGKVKTANDYKFRLDGTEN